jgi:hypothetical protein
MGVPTRCRPWVFTFLILFGVAACHSSDSVEPSTGSRSVDSPSFLAAGQSECVVVRPTVGLQAACGVGYTIDAVFFEGDVFWGRLMPGSIFIDVAVTFFAPIVSFTVTATPWEGSPPNALTIRAMGDSGQTIAVVDATGGGTFLLTGPGIVRVIMENDINGYYYTHATFIPDCAKPSDPNRNTIVESAEIRRTFVEALALSNFDSTNLHLRHEVGGWVYKRADGTYFARIWDDPGGTSKSCAISLPGAPAEVGAVPAGKFHTHPHRTGDDVYGYHPTSEPRGCPDIAAGKTGKARPLDNGGGSPEDWGSSFNESPLFTVAPDKKDKNRAMIFYLDPPRLDTESNPYRFQVSRQTPDACAARLT